MLASARAFVFYFNTERNAVYCVLYVFLFILYNTVFFIRQPWREEFGCKSTLQYSLDHKALFLEPYCIQEIPVTLRGASLPEKLRTPLTTTTPIVASVSPYLPD